MTAEALFRSAAETAITADTLRNALQRVCAKGRLPELRGGDDGLPPKRSRHPLRPVLQELRQGILAELALHSREESAASSGAAFVAAPEGSVAQSATVVAANALAAPPQGPCSSAADTAIEPLCVGLSLRDVDEVPLRTRTAYISLQDSEKTEVTLGCPSCRRPVEVCIQAEADDSVKSLGSTVEAATPATSSTRQVSTAQHGRVGCLAMGVSYCAVLCDCDRQSFLKAMVLGQSLATCGSTRDRVLLHSPDVPKVYQKALALVWSLQPIGCRWGLLPGRKRFGAASAATRLMGLQLREYSKVLILELGLVFLANPDSIFDHDCPAGIFKAVPEEDAGGGNVSARAGGALKRLDTSLLLLEPNEGAFWRISSDLCGQGVSWPPRGKVSAPLGCGPGLFAEYLTRFYSTFFSGDWQEISAVFAPLLVVDRQLSVAEQGGPAVVLMQNGSWWDSIETSLTGGEDPGNASSFLTGAAALVVEELRQTGRIPSVLGEAARSRCAECGTIDTDGVEDPVEGGWQCRFCWEALMFQASSELNQIDTSAEETDELWRVLGKYYLKDRRQRWTWSGTGLLPGWIEFRPKGVLWTRDCGVGAWEPVGGGRLAVHIAGGSEGESSEVRYIMQTGGNSGRKQGRGGNFLELSEWQREVFGPLGFGSLPRPEYRARAWPWRAPASYSNAGQRESSWHGRNDESYRRTTAERSISTPPTRKGMAPPPEDPAASIQTRVSSNDPVAARRKLAYLFSPSSSSPSASAQDVAMASRAGLPHVPPPKAASTTETATGSVDNGIKAVAASPPAREAGVDASGARSKLGYLFPSSAPSACAEDAAMGSHAEEPQELPPKAAAKTESSTRSVDNGISAVAASPPVREAAANANGARNKLAYLFPSSPSSASVEEIASDIRFGAPKPSPVAAVAEMQSETMTSAVETQALETTNGGASAMGDPSTSLAPSASPARKQDARSKLAYLL
eukprot:TRINITY_DN5364_c0_g1_i2.p1 TRINITY_DN5364_c0_g1~~TRINITY_DN5364_c0_g1_i2.p1  ORF type:complete len:966 (+),score=154.66 TRINITY_DN5364_c0_g1_i2:58-2955(+)